MKRFLRKRLKLNTTLTTGRVNSAKRFPTGRVLRSNLQSRSASTRN
ncbi:hypothetical protein [Leptospira noguchii]|nr:hypothetical protein [Leptospira noguchii]UOG52783.1 hypothetical protein MAL09_00640 [Leptospira noguchii]